MPSKLETSLNQTKEKYLNIIHFNDVYNVEGSDIEPIGGASRMLTKINDLKENAPTIVLFSGDALSPSHISSLVQGRQMIDVLNKFNISCSCLGNHEFDFGLDILLENIKKSNFPWILSNVFDVETSKPLANVEDKHILEFNDIRIGLIGLVEEEWVLTLSSISSDDIIFEPFIPVAKKLAYELKYEHKCELVIALTHMRWENDEKLAEGVSEIDLILGGHDHDYFVKQIKDKWIVKSGSDFRTFTKIELSVSNNNSVVKKVEKHTIDSSISENLEVKSIIDSYLENLNNELERVLGYINVELEGRFSKVRTEETNLGNFVCDIMLEAVNADCALVNSGSLRSDLVHPVGEFKVKDLKKIMPFMDLSIVISVSGSQLHQALENSVSHYPEYEGRFLQVSGLKFAFDPSKPSGNRIDSRLIKIQDEPLDLNREYAVATKNYLKKGKDGFQSFVECPILIDSENIPTLYDLVQNHFETISSLKKNRNLTRKRSSIVPLPIVDRLIYKLSEDPTILLEDSSDLSQEESLSLQDQDKTRKLSFPNAANLITRILSYKKRVLSRKQRRQIKQSEKFKEEIEKYEAKSMMLAPQIENRIIRIRDQEHFEQLLDEFKS